MADTDDYDMDAEVETAKADGWTVVDRDEYQVTLRKRSFGSLTVHLAIAVLTIWWAYGAVNVLYLLYAYLWDADRRVLTTEGEATDEGSFDSAPEDVESDDPSSAGTTGASDRSEQPERATDPGGEPVELIPFAEFRYEMVYDLASRVSSVPGFRLVMKLTVVWYRFAVMRCLGLVRRFRPNSTLVRRYEIDTVNVHEHFFAGYRGEEQPEIVRTPSAAGLAH